MKRVVLLLLAVVLLFGCGQSSRAVDESADIVTLGQSFPIISLGDDVLQRHCLVTKGGVVWEWGFGKVGKGTVSQTFGVVEATMIPRKIMDDVVYFAFPDDTSFERYMVIKSDLSLWAWGGSYLGDGTADEYAVWPVKIMDDVVAVQLNILLRSR